MGYIKEPEGVDFIIKSIPLSEREEREFVEFIEERKKLNKFKNKVTTIRRTTNKVKV